MIDEAKAIENLAANVERLMEARGWSASELARKSEQKPMTISRILHRSHMSTVPVVASIAAAFGVSMDSLLSESPAKKSVTTA